MMHQDEIMKYLEKQTMDKHKEEADLTVAFQHFYLGIIKFCGDLCVINPENTGCFFFFNSPVSCAPLKQENIKSMMFQTATVL
jgi:hypothetical protein